MPRRYAEFRSDTFTLPDAGMRRAIHAAEVGNAGFGEDPSVNALEAAVAGFFGRDAALFLPSATMAGQIAVRVWTRPGDLVLIEQYGHNHYFETGAMPAISGVQACPVPGERGLLSAQCVAANLRHPENPHARTSLVILENTANFGGGTVYPQATLEAIFALAAGQGLPVHIDGARVWNALIAGDSSPETVMARGGSMSVCFSKGLGAPMGACLVGEAEFVREARRIQMQLGGVMRQVGFMAAAALYALQHNYARLGEDHANAAWLADRLADVPGIEVDRAGVQTNMVYADVGAGAARAAELVRALGERGIGVLNIGHRIRFVTSLLVDRDDCEHAAHALRELSGAGAGR